MDSPIAGVLGTYELLEQILVNAPIRNLFVIQRVCRTWKGMIEQSHDIRKKMFLMGDGKSLNPSRPFEDDRSEYYSGNVRFNPTVGHKYSLGENNGTTARNTEHCAVFGYCHHKTHVYVKINIKPCKDLDGVEPGWPIYYTAYTNWTKMYITQPPVTAVQYQNPTLGAPDDHVCDIYNPDGITFGDLFEDEGTTISAFEAQKGSEAGITWRSMRVVLPLDDNVCDALNQQGRAETLEEMATCSCIKVLFGE